jgi:hypothetical protein
VKSAPRALKLRTLRTLSFSEASAADLVDALNLFLGDETQVGEKELVDLFYSFDGATHAAILVYTE